ncbi:MAG TPA: serine/threonine-protein kinase [Steroidobacteraceae bacterium]|jgi:tRNA A-37 threonylcarbamoyl transferase component Bud32|nr:serine/threonine-protein kinase [Steroidobacteraceae bacterium]
MDIDSATRISTGIDSIPGYRIDRLLDQGGMGGVYLAEDETLKRLVAIKVINPELTENTEFKKRFTTEALIIAGFQHPNIVTVFASGWLGPKQYFVMEYVRGGTLKQRLEAGPLSAGEAYRIGRQMADALAYSHERDVIHRDFKANNVLLRENGTPVLSDFGIAKSVVVSGEETAIGVVVGSALYMAPEQALGGRISNRVDIYSFGLVLYQMLTGKLPERHPIRTKDDGRQIARALRAVDGACVELITRCLRAAPEERPTAAECRDALAALAKRTAPRAGPEAPLRGGRSSLLVVASGAAAAVLLGFGAWRFGFIGASAGKSAAAASSPAAALVAPTSPAPAVTPSVVPDQSAPPVASKPLAKGSPAKVKVATIQAAPPPPATPAGMILLTVQVNPSSAKLFLDGNAMPGASMPLAPGSYVVAAVAPGYYGHFEHVVLSTDSASHPIKLALDATTLPTEMELQRFLKLQNQVLKPGQVQSMTDRTLREALRIQRFRQSNQASEVDPEARAINSLRHLGDSRAAVGALLIESLAAGHISRSLVTQPLIAGSDQGDALASFFLALAQRESFDTSSSKLVGSDPQLQPYCRRMGMAATQGLGNYAMELRRLEHCAK